MSDPDLVKVIVYGAKHLQGKKPGRHKYSVIFGVGSKKYRTNIVREYSGNPEWNEESEIHVANCLDQVFFIVTEKDDILGQIRIPVTSLSGVRGKNCTATLQSHKKCQNPHGELIYQCYISQYRSSSLSPVENNSSQGSKSGLGKLKDSTVTTPRRFRKGKKTDREGEKSNSSLSNFNRKFSRSIHDLFHFGKVSGTSNADIEINESAGRRYSLGFVSLGSGLDSVCDSPVISEIIPKFGTSSGGTRLTIKGHNLGLCKSDILKLTICDYDCLDTLEYESENKIICETKPCPAGTVDLEIETASGGLLFEKNGFTYRDVEEEETSNVKLVVTDCNLVTENGGIFKPNTSDDVNETLRTPSRISADSNLTRVKSTENVSGLGRFKKNVAKHARRASLATINFLPFGHEKEDEKDEKVEKVEEESEKDKRIIELEAENITLKGNIEKLQRKKEDMQSYINKLVSKVLMHCPEALEMEDEDIKIEDTHF